MKNSWLGSYFGWFNWNNVYGYNHARRNGVADGQLGVVGQPYAYELKNVFEGWINDFASAWAERDKALKAEYCSALYAVNRAANNYDAITTESASRDSALSDMEQQLREKLGADRIGAVGYSVAVVVLGGLELPINKIVVEALGLPGWEQWVASCGLSIMFVASAHFLGKLLKQQSRFGGLTSTERLLVGALLAVPLIALGFVALLREKYVIKLNALGLDITEAEVMLLFFAINLLFFIVGTMFAYTHHDPGIGRIRAAFGHDKRQAKGHRSALLKAEQLLRVEQDRLNRAEAVREKTHDQYFKRVRKEKDDFERLLSIYRKYKEREFTKSGINVPPNMISSIRMDVPESIAILRKDGQVLTQAALDKSCPVQSPLLHQDVRSGSISSTHAGAAERRI